MTSPHQESGPAPVREPDPAETEKSVLAAFTRWAEREHGIDLPDYADVLSLGAVDDSGSLEAFIEISESREPAR